MTRAGGTGQRYPSLLHGGSHIACEPSRSPPGATGHYTTHYLKGTSLNNQRGVRQSANVMLNGVKHLVTAQQRLYFFDQIL